MCGCRFSYSCLLSYRYLRYTLEVAADQAYQIYVIYQTNFDFVSVRLNRLLPPTDNDFLEVKYIIFCETPSGSRLRRAYGAVIRHAQPAGTLVSLNEDLQRIYRLDNVLLALRKRLETLGSVSID